jgi:DNA-formamidopyrimidine glycosylase
MPEGPEAGYVADFINNEFAGKSLQTVNIVKGRYVNHGPPAHFREFEAALPLKLESVSKKGKVIFFHFANSWTMISRLGMSGWWYSKQAPSWRSEFISVEFTFGTDTLIYSDPRSYGTLTLTKDPKEVTAALNELAPDMMEPATTWTAFSERLAGIMKKRPTMPIEELLVDQKRLVSGIGNYLKSEIMYAAKVAPTRPIRDVSEEEWRLVFKEAKRICKAMQKAVTKVGASGGETDAYTAQMAVYGKKQDPLGNEIKTYSNKAGRTVHWVPAVQH